MVNQPRQWKQAACLVEMGCNSAQGWYFARALEPTAVAAMLRRSAAGTFQHGGYGEAAAAAGLVAPEALFDNARS